MKFAVGALAAVVALAASAFAIPRTGANSHAFAAGGSIDVSVPVGGIHVVSTQSSRIEMHYTITPKASWFGSDADVLDNIHLRFDVTGNQAEIEFKDDNHNHNSSIHVEIDVPARENLHLHIGVGDLRITGIAGNLRLTTGVGDIRVNGLKAADFRSVDASTGVGSIEGGPFGQGDGFVGKSLSYRGNGQYHLTAHAGVGTIRLGTA